MLALFRTELLKLTTTRAPWLLAASTVVLVAGSAMYTIAEAGRRQAPSVGTTTLALNLLAGYGRGSLIVMVLGTLVATAEFRHGTITSSLLRTSDRVRLALAKALVVTVLSMAVGAAGLSVVVLQAIVAGALSRGVLSTDLAARSLGLLFMYPAYGLIGLGVGMLMPRYDALAALLPAAWVLFLEAFVLSGFTRQVPVWALTRVSAAASNAIDVASLPPGWAGVAALAGYAVASLVVGTARLLRSDIA